MWGGCKDTYGMQTCIQEIANFLILIHVVTTFKMATSEVVSVFLCVYTVFYQLCMIYALPHVHQPTASDENRPADGRGHAISAVVRQSSCSNPLQCLPEEFRNVSVPTDIVNCRNGVCSCRSCFIVTGSTCAIRQCWSFESGSCIDGRTRSQTTATLLSVFLFSVGAANFYIGRNDLGAIQLAIFVYCILASLYYCVLLCCCCYGNLHVIPHCCGCDDWSTLPDGDDPDEGPTAITHLTLCVCCCGAIVACIAVLVTIVWWLADLVIFATNQRLDINGCRLS